MTTEVKTTVPGNIWKVLVKVGDTVLYSKYGGTELKHEEKDYLIMKESDILAIIK